MLAMRTRVQSRWGKGNDWVMLACVCNPSSEEAEMGSCISRAHRSGSLAYFPGLRAVRKKPSWGAGVEQMMLEE